MRYDLETYQGVIDTRELAQIISAVLPFASLLLAVLMVSNVTYSHLVNRALRGKRSFSHLVHLLMVVIFVLVIREMSLVLLFWGFALTGPVRDVVRQARTDREYPVEEIAGS
jgi:phosphatidylserine synthase